MTNTDERTFRSQNDTRDRLVRLESEMDNIENTVTEMRKKVDKIHEVLLEAKGAKWVLIGVATVIGFAVGIIEKFIPTGH